MTTEIIAVGKTQQDLSKPADNGVWHGEEVTLAQAFDRRSVDRRLSWSCTIAAVDSAPFIVPRVVQMRCTPRLTEKSPCHDCLWRNSSGGTMDMAYEPKVTLSMLTMPDLDNRFRRVLDPVFSIPKRCPGNRAYVRLQEGTLLMALGYPNMGQESVHVGNETQEKYRENEIWIWDQDLDCQVTYEMDGYAVSHPKDNRATMVAVEARKIDPEWKNYRLPPAFAEELAVFQAQPLEPGGLPDVFNKVSEIHEFMESVHHIRGRLLQSMALGLVWFSPLWLPFEGEIIRGWLDILAFGDTGQGKTQLTNGFLHHFSAGDKASGKNATVPGLLCGVDKMNNRWIAKGGLMPRCDGGLLCLEEWHHAQAAVKQGLSEARAEGRIRMDKIARYRAYAQMRLCFLANCVDHRGVSTKMDSVPYPVQHILPIMGTPEDTRRLDYAVGFRSSNALLEHIYGKPARYGEVNPYTAELSTALVRWCWSRRTDQIYWASGAEREVLAAAQDVTATYSGTIPLVEPSDIRHKIARMSAAFAGHVFSSPDGHKLLVGKEHVMAARVLMEGLYTSPEMEYDNYSRQERMYSDTRKSDAKSLSLLLSQITRIDGTPGGAKAAQYCLAKFQNLSTTDIQTHCHLGEMEAGRFIAAMEDWGMLEKYQSRANFKLSAKGAQTMKDIVNFCQRTGKGLEDYS